MSFAWDITIPADTKEATPVERKLKITHGVITKMEVLCPPGCHKMVKVRLLKGKLFGLLPTNPDEWIRGDEFPITYETYLPIDDMPYELDFQACSPDTDYPHTISVRIEMLKEDVAAPWQTVKDFVSILRKLLGV